MCGVCTWGWPPRQPIQIVEIVDRDKQDIGPIVGDQAQRRRVEQGGNNQGANRSHPLPIKELPLQSTLVKREFAGNTRNSQGSLFFSARFGIGKLAMTTASTCGVQAVTHSFPSCSTKPG